MAVLNENLRMAQDQQKRFFDQNRIEREFEVGDMVYLRLQPSDNPLSRNSGSRSYNPYFLGPSRSYAG